MPSGRWQMYSKIFWVLACRKDAEERQRNLDFTLIMLTYVVISMKCVQHASINFNYH